jgi:hypothetical protein
MPTQFGTGFAGIATSTNAILLNDTAQSRGFLPTYQNIPATDRSDQAHHFSAFFQLGYLEGLAADSVVTFEVGEATLQWRTGNFVPVNIGDINLGTAAANHGTLSRWDLANDIKQLCQ